MSASARVVMIGAGQLARMTLQAAIDLDVELLVLAETGTDPAVTAGAAHRIGSHTDPAAVIGVAALGDVVTFDHELVPAPVLAALEDRGVTVRPGRRALGFAQDKLKARVGLGGAGFAVPEFRSAHSPGDAADFAAEHGWPVMLKARSGGYDGRGVIVIDGPAAIPDGIDWGSAEEPSWLVEEHLELTAELAVIIVRRPSGQTVAYPPIETTQVDGICRHLVTPATDVASGLLATAVGLATSVAEHIGAVGVCAVELFVVGERLLVNEVALRPHNSGHATIEANVTSQFHQHLRAVLDWPLGPTGLVTPAAAMVNLIGVPECPDPGRNLAAALAVDGARIHLYGKQSRPGRKIGHVTALAPTTPEALDTAQRAVDLLLAPAGLRP